MDMSVEVYYGPSVKKGTEELIKKNVHTLDGDQIEILRGISNTANFTFNIEQSGIMLAYITRSEKQLLPKDEVLVYIATALTSYVEKNMKIKNNTLFRTRVTANMYKFIKEWLQYVVEEEDKVDFSSNNT